MEVPKKNQTFTALNDKKQLVNKSNSAIFKAKIKVLCCPEEPYFLTETLLIRNSISSR